MTYNQLFFDHSANISIDSDVLLNTTTNIDDDGPHYGVECFDVNSSIISFDYTLH